MKNSIKRFFVIFVLFLFYSSIIYSQPIGQGEFMIVNKSENPITVRIYPNKAIFNGNYEYNLYALHPIDQLNEHKYIYPIYEYTLNQNEFKRANFDRDQYFENCDFSLGYGKYLIDIYEGSIYTQFQIDFGDYNYGNGYSYYKQKMKIEYYDHEHNYINFIDYDGQPYPQVSIGSGQTIGVWEQLGIPNPPTIIPDKGDFVESSLSQFQTWPLIASGEYQALYHWNPTRVELNLRIANHDITLNAGIDANVVKFENCKFTIDENRTLTINEGQNIYSLVKFTGDGAKFESKNNSNVYLPKNCGIQIFDNAVIDANSTIFTSYDIDDEGSAFVLKQAGNSTFTGCTFNNMGTPIYSENSNNKLVISDNNTFNYPHFVAIGLVKHYNVLIENNHFLLSNPYLGFPGGIDIETSANTESENNSSNFSQNINIIGNDFNGGSYHVTAYGSSEYLKVYIKENTFFNAEHNIVLANCGGTVLNNTFTNQLVNGICLNPIIASNPDIKSNNFFSNSINLSSESSSEPNLAPLKSNNQFIWIGGINKLHSSSSYNIYSNYGTPGYIYTHYGRNQFIIDNESQFHIGAYLNTESRDYYSYQNCWYIDGASISPQYWLINNANPPVEMTLLQGEPYSECASWLDQIVDRIITDMGNGVYDTVLITQANNDSTSSEDALLYGASAKNQMLKNYSSSITSFKNLVNNYPNSKYLEKTIFNLYECYMLCDTNHNQGWRNVIFGDLKNYLEAKIQQYDTNETFVNLAFDFLLKCKVKIKNYQPAMDGYAFIAENSPSPTERLMASINYVDVEGLLQGSGGGQNENSDNLESFNTSQSPKPIKDILLASYNKTKKAIEKKEKSDLQNSNDVSRTRAEQDNRHRQDKVLENRALENINISSNLTKEERRTRIQKDLMLLHQRNDYSVQTVEKPKIEPIKYELAQNYPNPFNPITNIKYQIQKAGIVTLKIYDITGREIKTLVNEIKNPGSYIVTFNGTEFSSGVYFYRIQSGDFVQVKKMLLIK
jgi:hypothetical protein